MALKTSDNAGVIAPPPLVFGAFFALGFLIDAKFETRLPNAVEHFRLPAAIGLGFAGILLGLGAIVAFRKVGTNVLPERPTSALANGGPYGFTRNPMYLGLTLLYLAFAIGLNKPIALLLLPAAIATIHHGVILREERYLERKFGQQYLEYKQRVRRWI